MTTHNQRKQQKKQARASEVQRKLASRRLAVHKVKKSEVKEKLEKEAQIKKEKLEEEAQIKQMYVNEQMSEEVQIRRNVKILKDLEREYADEVVNRKLLNEEMEAKGAESLEEKMEILKNSTQVSE